MHVITKVFLKGAVIKTYYMMLTDNLRKGSVE